MNFEERRSYVYDNAHYILENDEEAFITACEELDNWNGFLGDDRVYNMSELDDLLYRKSPLEIIEMVEGNNFSTNDDYFQFTMYGIESTDDKYDVYSSNYSVDDVLDELIDKYSHVAFYNKSLEDLVEIILELMKRGKRRQKQIKNLWKELTRFDTRRANSCSLFLFGDLIFKYYI